MKLTSSATLALAGLIASGCMKQSEKYCALHPEDTAHCGTIDGGAACLDNADCAAIDPATPVCADDRTCVQCTVTDDTACTDGRVCRGDRTCGDCVAHAECDSGVCQVNGRCALEASVAYVATNGGGADCTLAAPCATLIAAEATARAIIKVSGTITNPTTVLFDARSTTIYADPGASVTSATAGNLIEVAVTGTELTIYGLRLFGGTGGGTGNAVYVATQSDPRITLDRVLIEGNDGSGVRATDGGDITITRSVIANNFGNQGVYLSNGKFSITNTIIAQNGKTTIVTGGAFLQPTSPSTFEFNTVADNVSMGGTSAYRGVTCSSEVSLANNIIVGNDLSGCNAEYTLFSPGDRPGGAGNLEGDAMFEATTTPSMPTYYRLAPTSPAKDTADPAATVTTDIDGDTRPVDGRSDMGADEVTP